MPPFMFSVVRRKTFPPAALNVLLLPMVIPPPVPIARIVTSPPMLVRVAVLPNVTAPALAVRLMEPILLIRAGAIVPVIDNGGVTAVPA